VHCRDTHATRLPGLECGKQTMLCTASAWWYNDRWDASGMAKGHLHGWLEQQDMYNCTWVDTAQAKAHART
jgi:hypothetical protein